MLDKYKEYLIAFDKLDVEDKRTIIIDNLNELINLFYKVNKSLNKNTEVLPTFNESNTEEEFLREIFSYVISLKEVSAEAIENIIENTY